MGKYPFLYFWFLLIFFCVKLMLLIHFQASKVRKKKHRGNEDSLSSESDIELVRKSAHEFIRNFNLGIKRKANDKLHHEM